MDPILSVHIPKTAGTSVWKAYVEAFGAEHVLLDYDHHTFKASQRMSGKVNDPVWMQSARKISEQLGIRTALRSLRKKTRKPRPREIARDFTGIKVLHGHFRVREYLDLLPNAPRAVVWREPLERMWSNYIHWTRLPEGDIFNPWFRTNMSFEEFAMHPETRNHQSEYIYPLNLEDFDIVGVTQDVAGYLKRFEQVAREHFGEEINLPVLKENVTRKNSKMEIVEEFKNRFREQHAEDYDNYKKALKLSGN